MTPGLHVLAPESFEELLGGTGGPATVSALRASERSWRLLVLRALLDACADAPTGPLPPPADAWRLLTRARAAAEDVVEELLAYPAVGVWAAHTLRRLRGTADGDAPLWAELGHLHALAASAAIGAGLDFRAAVPVRHGWAVLPGLGAMRVAGAADTAEVSAVAGRVLVAGRPLDGPDWHALTRLDADGCALLLDDTDPYRTLRGPVPAEPVAADVWQDLFTEAWEILRGLDAEDARALAGGLVTLVPRPRAERFRPHSASSGDAFGAALASVPDDGEQLASTLVHEFQHNKLSAFMHLFTLYEDQGADRRLHYAPWRDDPRPLGGLLQGVYAFYGVTGFWRRRTHPLGRFEFALWRAQTAHALHAIAPSDGLTDLGRRLVAGLTARLEPWLAEPVPEPALAAAELAVADHRATWRAYHLRPDPGVVARACAGVREKGRAGSVPEALRVSAPGPAASEYRPALVPGSPARGFDTRAVLLRWLLADPAGFEALRADPGAAVSGARAEDIALVTGDTAGALRAFRERILSGGGDPETWVGLGLAARAAGDPAGEAVLARPELVMAVHAELGADADPLETARGLVSRPA
ncbi:HEXXH motif domain-containing protein [Streptomyces sp. TRM68416]|uniref:HEXXH motif domain-containing protein n=1 Tax=Streptomyces sp. TRM68416 TaxID=2758412 RepID=UPI001661A251|nr:HEXXH motif domain-containing protein [Streptomyces sp. TRM68416]MBD0840348.1 HEXXH motif domain-containing protein [Streptomyces sp. TRM68416]